MRSILVTGADTGVGKTWVVATLARLLASEGGRVEIVKVVETGIAPGAVGDAENASNDAKRQMQALNQVINFESSGVGASASASDGTKRLEPARNEIIGNDSNLVDESRDASNQIQRLSPALNPLQENVSRRAAGGRAAPARTESGTAANALGRRDNILISSLRAGDSRLVSAEGAIRFRTLIAFREALAPAAAAKAEGRTIEWGAVLSAVRQLPSEGLDWRVFEGAGGIASPIDGRQDWADFAADVDVDRVVVVVRDQLGAINQARLCAAHAARRGVTVAIWLNAMEPPPPAVAQSTREGITMAGLPLVNDANVATWAKEINPFNQMRAGTIVWPEQAATPSVLHHRLAPELAARAASHLLRKVRVIPQRGPAELDLSDNDYLALTNDPALIAAGQAALSRYGTSAAASPLIAGWKEPHERLLHSLCQWHHFPCGMLWSSGYAANAAVLSTLPRRGDLLLADRLVHHSMIAGLTRSGARFKRYPHLDLDRLEVELAAAEGTTFVVTESVFSMDGDYPDLARLAALKAKYPLFLILDEAHALGWYGPEGAGLAAESGPATLAAVDVFVGTLGKTLASGGAYTLFRDAAVRDTLVNHAGEFIYSTGIPPANAAIATAAIGRVRALASAEQSVWRSRSRELRAALRAAGWSAPDGDSPIIPIALPSEAAALASAESLHAEGIHVSPVRPPTVPEGTSRLRLSLKRTFTPASATHLLEALARIRERVA